jgi:hypothetical protein
LNGEEPIPHAVELSSAERWAYSGEWWTGFETTYKAVAIAYDHRRETLQVEYEGGTFWEYSRITFDEAVALYGAPSIGTWFWDNIRVRGGDIHAHQVEAVRSFG